MADNEVKLWYIANCEILISKFGASEDVFREDSWVWNTFGMDPGEVARRGILGIRRNKTGDT